MPDWQDLVTRFIGPILRTYIAALIGILSAHGFTFDPTLGDDILKAALWALPVLALSIWQKFQAAKLLKAGIAASPGTPVAVVRQMAKEA